MKKFVSAVLGTVIGLSTIFCPNLSWAESQTKIETITFDEALKIAIQNSNNLRIINNNLDTQETVNENSIISSGTSNIEDTFREVRDQQARENRLKSIEQDKKAFEESIEFLLKKTVLSIEKSEKSIQNQEKEIKNNKENLRISSIKYDAGKISKYDFETQQDKIEKDEKSLEIQKKSLETEYNNLDKILGVDILDRKKIKLEYKYEPLKDSEKEIPFKVTKSLEKDTNLYKKQLEVIEKDLNVRFTVLGDEHYRIKELNLAITENQIAELKDNMDKKIRDLYNSIKKNELTRESIDLELSTTTKDIEIMSKKLELGKAIPIEVKNLEFKKSQLEEKKKINELEHILLMLQYEKPYI